MSILFVAYFDYCKRNSNNNAKPRMMPTRQAESENPVAPAQQSDSDVEEIEEVCTKFTKSNNVMLMQLTRDIKIVLRTLQCIVQGMIFLMQAYPQCISPT